MRMEDDAMADQDPTPKGPIGPDEDDTEGHLPKGQFGRGRAAPNAEDTDDPAYDTEGHLPKGQFGRGRAAPDDPNAEKKSDDA
jgi:hypothetical protein